MEADSSNIHLLQIEVCDIQKTVEKRRNITPYLQLASIILMVVILVEAIFVVHMVKESSVIEGVAPQISQQTVSII